METLNHLREQARRAYNGTSFNPEKRGDTDIADYSAEMDSDLSTLRDAGCEAEMLSAYQERYERMISNYWGSHAACVSTIIAGPSNFPAARMNKRSQWADNHYNRFRLWREKAKKAILREIAGPRDELGEARENLKKREATQAYMKKINAAHKAYRKDPERWDDETLEDRDKVLIRTYVPAYSWFSHPFAPYQLTNNNANIKRLRDRVAMLEAKEVKKEAGYKREIPFKGGKIVLNSEADRVQIVHDEKPGPEVIAKLKDCAFRWSPSNKCWQRKLTNNSIYVATHHAGLEGINA